MTLAQQLLKLQRLLRERVWEAAKVQLPSITLDTDTTVHTLYGRQMGAVFAAVPRCVRKLFARADAGFYCWEAVQAYEKVKASFLIVARKTSRLLEGLEKAAWRPSPNTDADEQCEFQYQPEGWGKAYRFIALRYLQKDRTPRPQYQLFATPEYIYRVFVTDLPDAIDLLGWVYNQHASAENLIQEANNDAGLAAHPSEQWAANCVHFQLAMLAYNLKCWLLFFNREEKLKADDLKDTTLVTERLRFLFVSAKIWRHAGRVGISYSDQYPERGLFQRLMDRLRKIASSQGKFRPGLASALRS